MKNKMLLIALGVSFFGAMIIGLLSTEMVSAQECRLITVRGSSQHPEFFLEPGTSYINKGDCVVWFNRVHEGEITVSFKDGKTCLEVTKSPMGFKLDQQNCYVTSWISFGGTSSLRFMEKGTYKYSVRGKAGGGIPAEGQIVVE